MFRVCSTDYELYEKQHNAGVNLNFFFSFLLPRLFDNATTANDVIQCNAMQCALVMLCAQFLVNLRLSE